MELASWTLIESDNRPYTACGHRMAHRQWKETKLQPSLLSGPAVPGCSLLSFHFLWAIMYVRRLYIQPFPNIFENTYVSVVHPCCFEVFLWLTDADWMTRLHCACCTRMTKTSLPVASCVDGKLKRVGGGGDATWGWAGGGEGIWLKSAVSSALIDTESRNAVASIARDLIRAQT